MSFIYHTFFFDPLYNVLIFFLNLSPLIDAGVGVIVLTILVRIVIYPLSKKAVVTQVKMAELGPEINRIKEDYKNKPEEQAKKTLELYRENKVNPFSGIFVILIQLPIIFALYQIFLHFPEINTEVLYSFVSSPDYVNPTFLGTIDITSKSLILALLAGASTYLQIQVSMKSQTKPAGDSFQDNLVRTMQTQMKYVFPIIVFFISYTISGVIALYMLTTNLFSSWQETFIRKNIKSQSQV